MPKSKENWQLFIRHAHRDTHDRDLDNGLSDKGKKQGRQLVKVLRDLLSDTGAPKKVLSSPKLRCLQTAAFVAEWAGVEVTEEALLDEQLPNETNAAFQKRVLEFAKKHANSKGVAFVSHGDVLPIIAHFFGSSQDEVKKGDFFWVQDGHVTLFNGVRSAE